MNSKNETSIRGECAVDIIKDISIYYGLDWYKVPAGILIYNYAEYWLIKLNKNSRTVRKLWHQNHGRNGRSIPLQCSIEDLNNSTVQAFFHVQNNLEDADLKDLKKVCRYIYNHGNARRAIDSQKRALLFQAAFA
jgi:hypothetical protein